MEQFFDQMRREMFGGWDEMMSEWDRPALGSGTWDAGISIDETESGFVVLADLPGFERDELSLKLYDDVLVIRGEHEVDDGYESRSRTVHERISLPAHADPEHVSASYRNGVLEIEFVVEDDDSEDGQRIDIE
jgi:HSP20 family protein